MIRTRSSYLQIHFYQVTTSTIGGTTNYFIIHFFSSHRIITNFDQCPKPQKSAGHFKWHLFSFKFCSSISTLSFLKKMKSTSWSSIWKAQAKNPFHIPLAASQPLLLCSTYDPVWKKLMDPKSPEVLRRRGKGLSCHGLHCYVVNYIKPVFYWDYRLRRCRCNLWSLSKTFFHCC